MLKVIKETKKNAMVIHTVVNGKKNQVIKLQHAILKALYNKNAKNNAYYAVNTNGH
jgi:hypothetical protein